VADLLGEAEPVGEAAPEADLDADPDGDPDGEPDLPSPGCPLALSLGEAPGAAGTLVGPQLLK
jgi:hypothetical protein